jgi:hypothetical protein
MDEVPSGRITSCSFHKSTEQFAMPDTLVEDAIKAAEEARFSVSKLAAHIVALGRELEDCKKELEDCNKSWREFLKEDEARHKDEIEGLKNIIHKFLDLVVRPVGSRRFQIPESEETRGAISALCDAVSRNP